LRPLLWSSINKVSLSSSSSLCSRSCVCLVLLLYTYRVLALCLLVWTCGQSGPYAVSILCSGVSNSCRHCAGIETDELFVLPFGSGCILAIAGVSLVLRPGSPSSTLKTSKPTSTLRSTKPAIGPYIFFLPVVAPPVSTKSTTTVMAADTTLVPRDGHARRGNPGSTRLPFSRVEFGGSTCD